MKNLQQDNARLHAKCDCLEKKVVSLETKLNHLDQYSRRNNLVLSAIPVPSILLAQCHQYF